ncbi:hypothetical protein M8C21_016308 [Ambrosia artemisiifolia]|uniref:Homeobox domain-containing protein n=1 Tax=Ambrosia artemisiifolia TaxID=4212 RepID=A0AAD5CRB8_AMBAR|nr:hypothetical protein M8C21_016308 [Ambrosia artemisiifolia]
MSGDLKGGEPMVKRKKKTPFQLEVLELTYAGDAYPSDKVRAELSVQLDLTDRQLQKWFSNRRLKDKNTPTKLFKDYVSPMLDSLLDGELLVPKQEQCELAENVSPMSDSIGHHTVKTEEHEEHAWRDAYNCMPKKKRKVLAEAVDIIIDQKEIDTTDSGKEMNVTDDDSPEWAQALEPVRKLPTNVGSRIRRCIHESLDRNPPEWVREILEHSISKQVYKGNASGFTKRAVISVLEKVRVDIHQPKPTEKKEKEKSGERTSHEEEEKFSSTQSGIVCVQGYKVKRSTATILEAIFKKHGDIAADCVFKSVAVRSSFLEVVCEVVRRIQTNDVIEMEEDINCQLCDAEAANINVSWIRAHFEAVHKRKEARMLMETKANITLVKKPGLMDLATRYERLTTAYEQFDEIDRCMQVLHLVEKKLNNHILESKNEKDMWVKQPIL